MIDLKKYKVGAKVKIELNKSGFPRLDFGMISEGTGKYWEGVI